MGPCGRFGKPPTLPGSKLILTPPGELPKALIALVVVVENSMQSRGAQVHQSIIRRLLLLAARVAVKQVVDFIGDFCVAASTKQQDDEDDHCQGQ